VRQFISTLWHSPPAIKAALITALTSLVVSVLTAFAALANTPIKLWVEKISQRSRLQIDYESSTRYKLRDLLGRYRGLLLEAAESFNHRSWNLYGNETKGWLDMNGSYSNEVDYYFHSWVGRLVKLMATANAFEDEAIFIDPKIADKADFEFIYTVKSWSLLICDAQLFKGLSYDSENPTDHLFKDSLKSLCSELWIDGKLCSGKAISKIMKTEHGLHIYRLLDGLCSTEVRLRWDRFVCLHLLVMLFLNEYGYSFHRSTPEQFREVIDKLRHPEIALNFRHSLQRLHLTNTTTGKLISKLLADRAGVKQ